MKTCIRRIVNKQGKEITNSKAVMAELKGFYQDLYDTILESRYLRGLYS